MKKLIIVLVLAGMVYADYPKPTFTVNAHHFDRLHVPVRFDIVLLSDVLLDETDVERFYYVLRSTETLHGFSGGIQRYPGQWCVGGGWEWKLFVQQPGQYGGCPSSDPPLDLPILLNAGSIAYVDITAGYYDGETTFQLILCLPDLARA